MLHLLCQLGDASKLLLFSRYREDLANALEDAQSIEATENDIQEDIEHYIEGKLRLKQTGPRDLGEFVVVRNNSLLEEVFTALVKGSEGT